MGKKIVIALGGNALGETPEKQLRLVTETAKPIADLVEQGNKIVIVHGDGPQIGMINLGLTTAADAGVIKSDMPIAECTAMAQGYIGYHLQNAIGNELKTRGMKQKAATVVTQILIDEADPAFQHPDKPIGTYYDKETAERIARERGFTMMEQRRGWRRAVPSPMPVDIIEKDTVETLLADDTVVITVGGGGIPVVNRGGKLVGVSAVVDKDFASEKLAELIDADILIILTAVEKVAINYAKPDERRLDTLTPAEARGYIAENQFAAGSMLPKVEASVAFAESKSGRSALITKLEKAADGIAGKTGTRIEG